MMRPRPIVWFERLVLVAFGLGVMNLFVEWDSRMARMHSPYPVTSLLIGQLIYFGPYALLIWLISRRGNSVARGIFALVALIAGFIYLATLPAASDMSFSTALGAAQALLVLASLTLIFGRNTELWFRGRRGTVDPEIFR